MGEDAKLLDCPFCGSSTRPTLRPWPYEDDDPAGFYVVCSALGFAHEPNRGCGSGSAWAASPPKAIAAWNRRATEAKGADAEAVAWRHTVIMDDETATLVSDEPASPFADSEGFVHTTEPLYTAAALQEGREAMREAAAKVVDEFECALVEYPSMEAQDYYESGVEDAQVNIAAAVRALPASPAPKPEEGTP